LSARRRFERSLSSGRRLRRSILKDSPPRQPSSTFSK
jgi:hypothetical protein